jgi:hypothetical protein
MSEKITEITADDIVKPMAANHPEVRPNAVQAHQREAQKESGADPAQPKPTTLQEEVFKDKTGEKFHPEKHFADKFGRPQLTAGGYFRKIPLKKRLKRQAMRALGRAEQSEDSENSEAEYPKASEPAPEVAPEEETQRKPEPETEPESRSFIPEDAPESPSGRQSADEYRMAAKAICSTIFTIGVSVGGVQCKPLQQHVESMESSWETYFRARGKIDVPPGVAVALSTGGYALFCYQSSQLVQQQVGGIRGWIVKRIGNWKTNRAARKASYRKDTE